MNLCRPFFIILIVFAGPLTAMCQKEMVNFVKDELLVKFKPGTRTEAIQKANAASGAVLLESFGDLGWQRVKLPTGVTLKGALVRYQSLADVVAVQPNFYYKLLATPNDPRFGESGMYGLPKISAPQAWDIVTGNQAVVVANIDTGIRYTHEDLAANMWVNSGETAGNSVDDDGNGFIDDVYGYDFRFNDGDPLDEHGHGTHTAGTIGAVGNNNIGVVGVNWNVKLMAIKIYSASGSDTTSAMLINAYNYVRMMKNRGVNIRVTNNSYGGCAEACGFDQATKDAIDALGDADILNVFAAGNSGSNNDVTPFYPASYTSPSILAVAASKPDDERVFSYGLNSVDLAAPGFVILSTWNRADTGTNAYTLMSGTSMATPHVAGAAALLAGHSASLSAASLKATLMNTVDALPQWSGFVRTGGRLNVFNALQNQTVCNFGLAETSILAPTKGGQFTINITAQPNCDYAVKSNSNWIVVNGQSVLSGNGLLKFWVRMNPGIRRTGTIKIGNQTLTVSQTRDGIL